MTTSRLFHVGKAGDSFIMPVPVQLSAEEMDGRPETHGIHNDAVSKKYEPALRGERISQSRCWPTLDLIQQVPICAQPLDRFGGPT